MRDERVKEAASTGKTLTAAEAAAPLTADEYRRHSDAFTKKNAKPVSLEEANQRAAAIQKQ